VCQVCLVHKVAAADLSALLVLRQHGDTSFERSYLVAKIGHCVLQLFAAVGKRCLLGLGLKGRSLSPLLDSRQLSETHIHILSRVHQQFELPLRAEVLDGHIFIRGRGR